MTVYNRAGKTQKSNKAPSRSGTENREGEAWSTREEGRELLSEVRENMGQFETI